MPLYIDALLLCILGVTYMAVQIYAPMVPTTWPCGEYHFALIYFWAQLPLLAIARFIPFTAVTCFGLNAILSAVAHVLSWVDAWPLLRENPPMDELTDDERTRLAVSTYGTIALPLLAFSIWRLALIFKNGTFPVVSFL